jgi:hypothetical protein
MQDLPARFAAIIVSFAPLFRHRTWRHAEILLVGAILAPWSCFGKDSICLWVPEDADGSGSRSPDRTSVPTAARSHC